MERGRDRERGEAKDRCEEKDGGRCVAATVGGSRRCDGVMMHSLPRVTTSSPGRLLHPSPPGTLTTQRRGGERGGGRGGGLWCPWGGSDAGAGEK